MKSKTAIMNSSNQQNKTNKTKTNSQLDSPSSETVLPSHLLPIHKLQRNRTAFSEDQLGALERGKSFGNLIFESFFIKKFFVFFSFFHQNLNEHIIQISLLEKNWLQEYIYQSLEFKFGSRIVGRNGVEKKNLGMVVLEDSTKPQIQAHFSSTMIMIFLQHFQQNNENQAFHHRREV